MDWYLEVLKKYAVFDGRARRKEYWYFALFNSLIVLGLFLIGLIIGIAIAGSGSDSFVIVGLIPVGLYGLAIIIPSIAVTIRRLHDTNRSGWWYLITFVPWVGSLILFIFTVLDGTPGPNHYGPDPKAAERLTAVPPPALTPHRQCNRISACAFSVRDAK